MAITKRLFRTDKNADATRKAKPSGYRYRDTSKNKHNYNRPTAEEIEKFEAGDERMRQIIYKESRPERSDINQKNKLEKGGHVNIWSEIRSEFVDEDGTVFIDGYVTGNDNEEGKVIAKVDKHGNVFYLNLLAEKDSYAQEVINQIISDLKSEKEYAKGGSIGDIDFKTSNLRLVGYGKDVNGNHVVKVSFPNQKAFSIQTLGDLYHSNKLLRGKNKLSELEPEELELIEKEVNDYVRNYGSVKQKKSLRLYGSKEYKKGGAIKRSKAGIAQDKTIKAKHAGKRTSAEGNTYYENRENRSDVNRTKKFATGGDVENLRDSIKNLEQSGYTVDSRILGGWRVSKDGETFKASDKELISLSEKHFAKGGDVTIKKIKFNSHTVHNPNTDIVVGYIDDDSMITYYVIIKGDEKGKEGMEYYTGENYVVGSNKKSNSRNYPVEKIPAKYKKAWDELKVEYESEYKDKYAQGGNVNSEYTSEWIESQLGRKLNTWSDYSVKIKGNEYEKIPFKSYYRLTN